MYSATSVDIALFVSVLSLQVMYNIRELSRNSLVDEHQSAVKIKIHFSILRYMTSKGTNFS